MPSVLIGVGLVYILPVMFGFATLVVMLERYYDLTASVACGLVVALIAFKNGATRCQRLRSVNTFGQAASVLSRVTFAYAAGLGAAVIADIVSTRLQILVPWLLAPIAGLAVYLLIRALLLGDTDTSECEFLRGRKLIDYREAISRAGTLLTPGDSGIYWGGLRLPSHAAVSHFCVAGATGSGKTVTLRLLMQSVLPAVGRQKDTRALVYDAKQDIVSLLHGMGLAADIRILNPFDARSWAWDIARDVTSPATAAQIASILISKEEGSNRFFSDAAQHLLTGVLISLIRSEKAWTFRDVLLIAGDPHRLRIVLERDPHTRGFVPKYFQDERLLHNILSTLASKTMLYEPVAAVWEHAAKAGRVVSLQEWVRGSFILVLGNDETIRAPMDAINRVLFQRASELLLAGTESGSRRSWVFLDEVAKAGKLDGLDTLLTKGRSKGVCVVIGFQDIDSLRDPLVYGEHVANALLGQCANKAILRLDSESTARWAAGLIGEYEAREYHASETTGGQGGPTQTRNEQHVKRETVLASELLSLPQPDASGLHGYCIIPLLGVYRALLEFIPLLSGRGNLPDLVHRPVDEQYLAPWSAADEERLGLSDGNTTPAQPALPGGQPASRLDDIPRMTREDPDVSTL